MSSKPAERAFWAVFVIFLIAGIAIGSWAPHVALAKERLQAGPAVFGLALLSIACGAVIAMPIAGALINKLGSAQLTMITSLLFVLAFFGPTSVSTLPAFIVSAFFFGSMMGSMDVSMNAHGIAVEKSLGRPIMSRLHGAYSLGAMVGALAGGTVIDAWGPLREVIAVAIVAWIGLLICGRFLLPTSIDRGLSSASFAFPTKATIGLGLLCFLALMVEGSVLDWAAIMMREKFVIDAGVAAMAFGFYQAGMAITRLLGDKLRQVMGAVALVTVSACLAAAGTAVALLSLTSWLTFAAFFCSGLGIGNVAPVLFAGGGRLEPDAPGRGIAAVTTLGYSGFLVGPPLIGFVAQFTSLPLALGLTVLGAVIIAIFARGVAAADTY